MVLGHLDEHIGARDRCVAIVRFQSRVAVQSRQYIRTFSGDVADDVEMESLLGTKVIPVSAVSEKVDGVV